MKTKILLVLTIAIFLVIQGCNNEPKRQLVPVTDFNGLKPWLTKQTDSVYVINFWATWCTPCVKEFPDFELINKEYKDKKVKVLMVNLDFPDQNQKRVLPFLKARKSELDVIMLDDSNQNVWINGIDSSWSGAIPATLIYSLNKREFYESELSFNQLDSLIKEHLIINK
ncbi:MAG: TlpA family protein disulfide reductase [Tenuifilaceae bacterium]